MTTLNAHDYSVGEILTAATMDGVTSDLNTLLSEVEGSAYIETGAYTGDGTTGQTVNLTDTELIPHYLKIYRAGADGQVVNIYTSTSALIDDDADGLGCNESSSQFLLYDKRINAFATGSFTVSDDASNAHPNSDTIPYSYLVIGRHA